MKMTPFAPLDDNLDYQDVKLKIVQQEGYDAHDFNLFDDRASQLWRKPYVEGAVQELTSGDNRSAEQLRVAVEQMMLAAGNQNPDVRMTGSAAPKSGATVKVDAQIDNEEDVLRDMRAIRLGPSPRPKQKHPPHAPGPAQDPPARTHKNAPRAAAGDPVSRPSLLVPGPPRHGILAVHRSPPQRFSDWLTLLATEKEDTKAVNEEQISSLAKELTHLLLEHPQDHDQLTLDYPGRGESARPGVSARRKKGRAA